MSVLTLDIVRQEYHIKGLSDRQIAEKYGVVRTAVTKFRSYHDIKSRAHSGDAGESLVKSKLENLGFQVDDMNKLQGKTHPYDLLVNKNIRVEVKTAKFLDNKWTFVLTNKHESGMVESAFNIRLPNGRIKKDLSLSSDIVILCALIGQEAMFFVMPSTAIPKDQQTLSVTANGKWAIWRDRWELIIK
ncbi:hypothetical protein ACFPES_03340 [Paenibacillus sp. GCM10023248]|uniref:hypothetical protein n=1 Tax=unclassified Paenibacillus TaxID=185978 RepID=UPI002378BA3D|nr:hypothetical protein [Paenibacillus sp. MAHUQ-63]MDD9266060.1 hypothetical protein [Paenibacillus sp. MAHUQ-63]